MTVVAACHIHSEWSYDATWRLGDLAAEFARRRYSVLLMAEHDRNFSESRFQEYRAACAEASSPDLLVVPGIEYSDADNVVHVPTWGLDSFLGERLETAQMLEGVSARHGVAVLAHPASRNAWQRVDPSWTRHFVGVEIWNRKYDGWAPSAIAAGLLPGTIRFASLDFHARNQFFPLSMQLDLSGPLTEQSVLECIRARRCHAAMLSQPVENFLRGWRSFSLTLAERMRRLGSSLRRTIKVLN